MGSVSRSRSNAGVGHELLEWRVGSKPKANEACPLFLSNPSEGHKARSLIERIRAFFSGSAMARKHVATSASPNVRQVKTSMQEASATAQQANTSTPKVVAASQQKPRPVAEAAMKFKSFFPGGIPSLNEVLASRAVDPQVFEVCRQMLSETSLLVTLDCRAALDDLRNNPTLERACKIRDKFIQDPRTHNTFGYASANDKLNLYESAYDNFTEKFKTAEKALSDLDDEAGQKLLLAAFDIGIGRTLTQDARDFKRSVQALFNQHLPAKPAAPLRPEPDRFA